MAIIDRIKYDGDLNNSQWLIYKYPSEEFVLGSQLIINQVKKHFFLKEGKLLICLVQGHTLYLLGIYQF